jgi:hypothetical protein
MHYRRADAWQEMIRSNAFSYQNHPTQAAAKGPSGLLPGYKTRRPCHELFRLVDVNDGVVAMADLAACSPD